MTTIISAIMGGYDKPKIPIPQSIPVDYVMVTDDKDLRCPGWEKIVDPNPDNVDPRVWAKSPKLFPWNHSDNGPWIWVDGSMQINSRTFAAEALAATDVLGQWEHPDRKCALAEARFSATLPKYAGLPLPEQAQHYWQAGHPEDWGLWACGLIVYKTELSVFSSLWSWEIREWTVQDQVSQPFVLRNLSLRPESLPHSLRSNPWISIIPHRDGTS